MAPVIHQAAAALGWGGLLVIDPGDPYEETTRSTWALMSPDDILSRFPVLGHAARELPARPSLPLWTDDYSNLFRILR